MIGPDGQFVLREAIVSCRRTKEKYILLGGANEAANGLRKKLAEPRSAGEHIAVCGQLRTIGKRQALADAVLKIMRQDRSLFAFMN